MAGVLTAYIDESLREAVSGLYVLASVTVPGERAEGVRGVLRAGLRNRRPRFHWTDEQSADREAMTKVVSDLALPGLVVVASPMDPRRSERARRVCLTRLLWELGQRGVHEVVLESRQGLDGDDRVHIVRVQRAGYLAAGLRYTFGRPLQEPLLWLPDLVAGAVAYDRTGVDLHYLQMLSSAVTIVDAGPGT